MCIRDSDETNDDLKYAEYNGSSWEISTVDDGSMTGRFSSIALDSQNKPYISYCDQIKGKLMLATKDGSTWNKEVVDISDYHSGYFTSITLDSADNPYISYLSYIHPSYYLYLNCAYYNGTEWVYRTIGNNGGLNSCTSIVLDATGTIHILYNDAQSHTINHAWFR